MKWFVKCIRNYVNFTGRASRVEFWSFIFVSILLTTLAFGADYVVTGDVGREKEVFQPIVRLFLILPQLAVMVRRLHDVGRSGLWGVVWWVLSVASWMLSFSAITTGESSALTRFAGNIELPLVGVMGLYGLLLLSWLVKRGDKGGNKYGPEPKTYGRE